MRRVVLLQVGGVIELEVGEVALHEGEQDVVLEVGDLDELQEGGLVVLEMVGIGMSVPEKG